MTLFDHVADPDGDRGPPKVRWTIAYDGTDFRGFAASRGVRTVEGVLCDAAEKVAGKRPELSVAGRTDKGVHARANVVTFEAQPGVDADYLAERVNSMLGPEVVVTQSDLVDAAFDARRSAKWRTYRYTVLNRPVADPFRDRFAWWVRSPLELAPMRMAADVVVGEHDFTSFCRRGPEGSSSTRRVFESRWLDMSDGVLVYEIRASAFCWQMVRAVVGTLVEVGSGKRTPGELLGVIRARDRMYAGQLSPPRGLCLWAVGYDD